MIVECDAADAACVLDRLLFGSRRQRRAPHRSRIGRAATAASPPRCGGTLFLQDVTELPAAAQARLARHRARRRSAIDGEPVATDVRLHRQRVARRSTPTSTPIASAPICSAGSPASRIDLPPLRDRREDVPALAPRLLDDIVRRRAGRRRATFTQAALALLGGAHLAGQPARAARRHRARRRRDATPT